MVGRNIGKFHCTADGGVSLAVAAKREVFIGKIDNAFQRKFERTSRDHRFCLVLHRKVAHRAAPGITERASFVGVQFDSVTLHICSTTSNIL